MRRTLNALLTALAGMLRILPSVLALREFPRQVPNNDAVTPAEVLQIKNNGDSGVGLIPEPASAALLALGSLLCVRRRRH